MTNNISYPSSFILLSLSVFGTLSLILVSVTFVSSGSHRPYGVSLTGFQDSASGTSGHDISANGYAGRYIILLYVIVISILDVLELSLLLFF